MNESDVYNNLDPFLRTVVKNHVGSGDKIKSRILYLLNSENLQNGLQYDRQNHFCNTEKHHADLEHSKHVNKKNEKINRKINFLDSPHVENNNLSFTILDKQWPLVDKVSVDIEIPTERQKISLVQPPPETNKRNSLTSSQKRRLKRTSSELESKKKKKSSGFDSLSETLPSPPLPLPREKETSFFGNEIFGFSFEKFSNGSSCVETSYNCIDCDGRQQTCKISVSSPKKGEERSLQIEDRVFVSKEKIIDDGDVRCNSSEGISFKKEFPVFSILNKNQETILKFIQHNFNVKIPPSVYVNFINKSRCCWVEDVNVYLKEILSAKLNNGAVNNDQHLLFCRKSPYTLSELYEICFSSFDYILISDDNSYEIISKKEHNVTLFLQRCKKFEWITCRYKTNFNFNEEGDLVEPCSMDIMSRPLAKNVWMVQKQYSKMRCDLYWFFESFLLFFNLPTPCSSFIEFCVFYSQGQLNIFFENLCQVNRNNVNYNFNNTFCANKSFRNSKVCRADSLQNLLNFVTLNYIEQHGNEMNCNDKNQSISFNYVAIVLDNGYSFAPLYYFIVAEEICYDGDDFIKTQQIKRKVLRKTPLDVSILNRENIKKYTKEHVYLISEINDILYSKTFNTHSPSSFYLKERTNFDAKLFSYIVNHVYYLEVLGKEKIRIEDQNNGNTLSYNLRQQVKTALDQFIHAENQLKRHCSSCKKNKSDSALKHGYVSIIKIICREECHVSDDGKNHIVYTYESQDLQFRMSKCHTFDDNSIMWNMEEIALKILGIKQYQQLCSTSKTEVLFYFSFMKYLLGNDLWGTYRWVISHDSFFYKNKKGCYGSVRKRSLEDIFDEEYVINDDFVSSSSSSSQSNQHVNTYQKTFSKIDDNGENQDIINCRNDNFSADITFTGECRFIPLSRNSNDANLYDSKHRLNVQHCPPENENQETTINNEQFHCTNNKDDAKYIKRISSRDMSNVKVLSQSTMSMVNMTNFSRTDVYNKGSDSEIIMDDFFINKYMNNCWLLFYEDWKSIITSKVFRLLHFPHKKCNCTRNGCSKSCKSKMGFFSMVKLINIFYAEGFKISKKRDTFYYNNDDEDDLEDSFQTINPSVLATVINYSIKLLHFSSTILHKTMDYQKKKLQKIKEKYETTSNLDVKKILKYFRLGPLNTIYSRYCNRSCTHSKSSYEYHTGDDDNENDIDHLYDPYLLNIIFSFLNTYFDIPVVTQWYPNTPSNTWEIIKEMIESGLRKKEVVYLCCVEDEDCEIERYYVIFKLCFSYDKHISLILPEMVKVKLLYTDSPHSVISAIGCMSHQNLDKYILSKLVYSVRYFTWC